MKFTTFSKDMKSLLQLLTAFSLVAINKMSLIYNHGLNILFCKRQVNARL